MTLIEFKKYCVDFLINAASGSIKSAIIGIVNEHLFWNVMALRWFFWLQRIYRLFLILKLTLKWYSVQKRNEHSTLSNCYCTLLLFSSMVFPEGCLPLINPVWSVSIKVEIIACSLADCVSLHWSDIGQKLAHLVLETKYYNRIK